VGALARFAFEASRLGLVPAPRGTPGGRPHPAQPARQLMNNLDTLAHAATLVAVDNRERIRQTAENIRVVSIKMEYLMDQLSRRPLKVISGVKPLDHDSIVAQSDSAAAKK
jgi:hypothetical protein